MNFDIDCLGEVKLGRERDFNRSLLLRDVSTWWAIVGCEVCPWVVGRRGQQAMEESHLWDLAHEHTLVGAIGQWLEEDISSIVG